MKNAFIAFTITLLFAACTADNPSNKPEKSLDEITNATKIFNTPKSAIKDKKDAIPKDTINVAKMAFELEEFDFGTVDDGEKVEYIYKFENVGKVPLTITQARSTCGCTVPQFPKEPIAIGETGEIKVIFNTAGKRGHQEKPVMITANTWPTVTTVKLKGDVINPSITPKEKAPVAKQ